LCVLVAACEIRIATRLAGDDVVDPACGNFQIDPGEVCDDGNTADGDGCSANCTSDETCGNGVVDTAMDETCDDANQNGGDGCSADCKSDETCGNGIIDLAKGETCDDGNLISGDNCSANCQSNEQCGNGVTDSGVSPAEECDDGPTGSATCDVNCTVATCGDGTVNTLRGEQCDAGPQGSASCDTNCTTAFCGDSTVNALRGEQCDDGNNISTDACVSCKTAFCGDGFTQANVEQCDDKNTVLTDGCTLNCKLAFCGDGFIRAGVEQCDDSNQVSGDGCSSTCQIEPVNHVIASQGQLGNMATQCDGLNENFYDGCNNTVARSFTWTDNSPFQPTTLEITFNRGIDCAANSNGVTEYVVTTDLNGVNFNDITITSDPLGCFCTPTEVLHTVTISGSGYVRGGANTFTFQPNPIAVCSGLSIDPGIGGFAVVRTFP
jgi:cysteine-rich repeat protein